MMNPSNITGQTDITAIRSLIFWEKRSKLKNSFFAKGGYKNGKKKADK